MLRKQTTTVDVAKSNHDRGYGSVQGWRLGLELGGKPQPRLVHTSLIFSCPSRSPCPSGPSARSPDPSSPSARSPHLHSDALAPSTSTCSSDGPPGAPSALTNCRCTRTSWTRQVPTSGATSASPRERKSNKAMINYLQFLSALQSAPW